MVVLFPFLDGPSALYFRGGAFVFSFGALLLILGVAGQESGVLARLLGWGPVAYLGRISYGIYLWHWPYAVWLGTAHTSFSWWRAALVVVLTVASAAASYHLVELPIRSGHLRPWRTTRRTLVTSTAWLAAMTAVTTLLGGTPFSPFLVTAEASGTTGKRPPSSRVLMVGDSVPLRLMPALAPVARSRGITVDSAMGGGCSPLAVDQLIAPDDVEGAKCPAIAETQTREVATFGPGTVVWWSRYETAPRYDGGTLLTPGTPQFWAAQLRDFTTAVNRLTARGAVLVVVLTEPPGLGMKTRCSARKCHPFLRSMVLRDDLRTHWNELVTQVAAKDPRVRVTHVWDTVCHSLPTPGPGAPWGSALCDDTVRPGKLARPDGSHFDVPLVGAAVARTLLARVDAAAAR